METALWAAQGLMQHDSSYAFPRYCDGKTRNANLASAAPNKWMKTIIGGDYVVHGLQQSLRDRLRSAECRSDIIDQIGGWTSGKVGDGYGEGPSVLQTKQWMTPLLLKQTEKRAMKILGIGICFAIILGAFFHTGPHLYLDINSAIIVLGGATGFLVMKNKSEKHLQNFGQGAVYFGWLGTAVGLIAITGTPSFVWGNVEKLGPAFAVAMLTVLYGYMVKLVAIGLAQD